MNIKKYEPIKTIIFKGKITENITKEQYDNLLISINSGIQFIEINGNLYNIYNMIRTVDTIGDDINNFILKQESSIKKIILERIKQKKEKTGSSYKKLKTLKQRLSQNNIKYI